MEIQDFEKLKSQYEHIEFNDRYKIINRFLVTFSYFGHIASILIGFYFIYTILKNVISSHIPESISGPLEAIIAVTFLILFELLKRYLFNQASFEIVRLKFQNWTKGTWLLTTFSIVIIAISFYFGISGASTFSNQSSKIENNNNIIINTQKDSLTKILNKDILNINNVINERQKRITSISNRLEMYNRQLLNTTGWKETQLKTQIQQEENNIKEYDKEIKLFHIQIDSLKKSYNNEILAIENKISNNTTKLVTENSNNTLKFIFIVAFVELLILIGIYFHNLYEYYSYIEGKELMTKDPKWQAYQTWIIYEQLLMFIFQDGKSGINDKAYPYSRVLELTKISNMSCTQKDVSNIFQIIEFLGIIVSNSNYKLIKTDLETAKQEVRKHLGLLN